MSETRHLRAWNVERPSVWWRYAFPLTFLAGGLTFIVLPSLVASRADAGDEVRTRRSVWERPPEPMEIGRVNLLRASEMRAALERLRPDSRGVMFSSSQDRRAQFILNRRTGASDPELHADWDDVFVFQSGIGTLRFGGQLIGARALGEKERRGGQLDNELVTEVEPGDVLRVPAGVPHQVEPLGDAPLVYLVIKLKAPLEILPDEKATYTTRDSTTPTQTGDSLPAPKKTP